MNSSGNIVNNMVTNKQTTRTKKTQFSFVCFLSQRSVHFSAFTQSCSTLCDPIDCGMPGLHVQYQLPEFTQTHVTWVGWCHPTISSSVIPFSPLPQSLPASGFFQMSKFSAAGGQNIGVSASASVLPMNIGIMDWFPLGWISLQSKGLSRVFSITTVQKHHFFRTELSLWSSECRQFDIWFLCLF